MENNINFIRFANFLQEMLEKYGAEVMAEILLKEDKRKNEDGDACYYGQKFGLGGDLTNYESRGNIT